MGESQGGFKTVKVALSGNVKLYVGDTLKIIDLGAINFHATLYNSWLSNYGINSWEGV